MRSYARLDCGILENEDWCRLTPNAQSVYTNLLAQVRLNMCGVTDWIPKRLVRYSATTIENVEAGGRELQNAGFIIIDDDMEEVLIRSFLRHDAPLSSPKTAVGVDNAYRRGIMSKKLKSAIVAEALRLHREHPDWSGWAKVPYLIEDMKKAEGVSQKPLQIPSDTDADRVSDTLSDTPSHTPSDTATNITTNDVSKGVRRKPETVNRKPETVNRKPETANHSLSPLRAEPAEPSPADDGSPTIPDSSSQCSNQQTPDQPTTVKRHKTESKSKTRKPKRQPSPAGDADAESSSENLAFEEEPVTVVVEEESPTTPNPAAPFADEDADGAGAAGLGVGELAAAELVDDHTPPCKDPRFGGMTVRQALAAWQPNEEHRRLASELGVDCDVEATVMRSWGRSHPEKVDWQDYDANFTLWMSRTHKWDAPGSKRGRTGKSKTQANLEENAGVVMEIARESAEKRKTQNNKPRRSYR